MRIALIAPLVTSIVQPYVGGSQALVAELARGLVKRGHTVTLFARQGSFVPGVTIEIVQVPDAVQPANFAGPARERPADSGFFAQANRFLQLFLELRQRQDEFDIVHAHAFDWPAFVSSALLTRLPILHTLHLPALSPEINEALRVLQQQGHPLTLITVSKACARTYADYIPMDAVIYNGLDSSTIPFVASVPEDAPLLFAGRIAPEKGVEAAIEIARLAGHHLLIAGGVYDAIYYNERIVPLLERFGEHITYLGQLEHTQLWQRMGQALGLLFPIEWDEPFGLVAVEAMATGTPVIAFRRGAAEEIILTGETGFLVEAGNRIQAAEQVALLARLSRVRCRAHVEQYFSFEHMLDEHERLYTQQIRR
jgi:UDP-glucose:tetrahydrobiopterin glucosyltransferase